MDELLEKIWHALPDKIQASIQLIKAHNIEVLLVGGPIRDFILYQRFVNHDFDLELRFLSAEHFHAHYQQIIDQVNNLWTRPGVQLEYHVYQWKQELLSLDLAPARKEIFSPTQHHHSNFHSEILYHCHDQQAFIRRDMTINALGLEFVSLDCPSKLQLRLADPFGGLDHLKQKILTPCGPDFFKDPLRLLRACRFSSNLQFKFSDELKEQIALMNLSELSSLHFWKEFNKAYNLRDYLGQLEQALATCSHPPRTELALAKTLFKDLKAQGFPESSLRSSSDEYDLKFLSCFLLPKLRRHYLPLFLCAPGQSTKDWQSFLHFLDLLQNFPPPWAIDESFEDFLHHPQLNSIKEIYQYSKRHRPDFKRYQKHSPPHIPQAFYNFLKINFEKKIQFPTDLQAKQRGLYQIWSTLRDGQM